MVPKVNRLMYLASNTLFIVVYLQPNLPMYSADKIEKEFTINSALKERFWKDGKLNPEVRDALMKIAKMFHESIDTKALGIEGPIPIEDITFTGSLANFNYSDSSDVDLHIVVDYEKLGKDKKLIEEFLALKRTRWNEEHDITIYGHDVEVYVEDKANPHTSTGLYSVLNDKWIKEPVSNQPKFNPSAVAAKANHFKHLYRALVKKFEDGDLDDVRHCITCIKEKWKKYRKAGLQSGGEFSTENLAFKVLRRSGLLDAFTDLYNKTVDKKLSVENIMSDEPIKLSSFIPDALMEDRDDKESRKHGTEPMDTGTKKLAGSDDWKTHGKTDDPAPEKKKNSWADRREKWDDFKSKITTKDTGGEFDKDGTDYAPGKTWKTTSGKFGGKNRAGSTSYFDNAEAASKHAKS